MEGIETIIPAWLTVLAYIGMIVTPLLLFGGILLAVRQWKRVAYFGFFPGADLGGNLKVSLAPLDVRVIFRVSFFLPDIKDYLGLHAETGYWPARPLD